MTARRMCVVAAAAAWWPSLAWAQQEPAVHQHAEMATEAESGWELTQDGVVYGVLNHQGGPRGGTEFVVPNWWMGMWMRGAGRHQFGVNAMVSLDAGTLGKDGYREIFQVGESLDGRPLIDRQHPHDLFMQLAASWRVNIAERTAVVIAGGPAGEPTLGPVVYMHRASASGLPFAPLGHHTFDSTHISFGVITAAIDHGRWTVEGSVFNGREPDEHRWDLDLGPMDSVAGRVWFRPTAEWALQVSTGLLREPEALVPGDARRTTVSGSWTRSLSDGFVAATVGYGVTGAHDETRHGGFAEFSREGTPFSVSGRLELQQVETGVLISGEVPDHTAPGPRADTVAALALGAARSVGAWRGFEAAVAGQLTIHGVPAMLRPTHGNRPISFQALFRLRLPAGRPGRMWNMRMSAGHDSRSGHVGHVMP